MSISGVTTSRLPSQQVASTQQVAETPKPQAPANPQQQPAPVSTPERVAAPQEIQDGSRVRTAANENVKRTQLEEHGPKFAPSLDDVRAGNGKLMMGQEGDSVRQLQKMLNDSGTQPKLREDGKFGLNTRNAVESYQRSRDVTDTGVVGQTTLQALDQKKAPVQAPGTAGSGARVGDVQGATKGMTEAQKYDYYKNLIQENGGKFKDGVNQRNIVSVRQETSTKANGGQGVYDDHTAMLWMDKAGNKRVKEYQSNTEPSARYEGRMGEDANRDGKLDLGRLPTGYYEYRTSHSAKLGNVLRPTQDAKVDRDTNHDGKFNDGAQTYGGASMLFHAGGRNMTGSAGCQTMPPDEYARFWRDLNKDGNPGTVGYTLVRS